MAVKTLGQIASEAIDAYKITEEGFEANKAAMFEAAAQAVRAAVIEECAKECMSWSHFGLRQRQECHAAILSIKDKK